MLARQLFLLRFERHWRCYKTKTRPKRLACKICRVRTFHLMPTGAGPYSRIKNGVFLVSVLCALYTEVVVPVEKGSSASPAEDGTLHSV